MSLTAVKPRTDQSAAPELQSAIDDAMYRMVQLVLDDACRMKPSPCNREIADALRATVGENAVKVWEDFIEELGF